MMMMIERRWMRRTMLRIARINVVDRVDGMGQAWQAPKWCWRVKSECAWADLVV